MALPNSISSLTPAGSDSPSQGDDIIRAKSLALIDILGIPDATNVSQAAMDIDAGGLAQIIFYDPAVTPATGELGRSGSTLYYRITDARTNTTTRALGIIADTSGTPAASIGVGMLFQAESADETPSDFGALDFVASDIGAGTEDTYASLLLRVAGRALDEKYRFASTAGDGFAAMFTHANTADRTYTFPDSSGTVAFTSGGTFTDVVTVSDDDAVNNDVTAILTILHTTSGSPAAGMGTRLLFQGESADENPSNFGALDFVATDIGAGTEDTYARVLLRVAGGAIDEKYRLTSTAGSGFTAIFAHAATADRTYTFPDASGTLAFTTGGAGDFTAASSVSVDDATNNNVTTLFTLLHTTSGSPAAGIGSRLLFQSESADENPSSFGALDFVASDVGAGTEDTYASLWLRVAGATMDEKYRFVSTAGAGFTAIFTHAATADRTYTLPNASDTLVGKATTDTLTNKSVDLTSNTLTGTTAQFNTALSDDNFSTSASSETLTNKTVNLTSNTLTGTTAQFNTALSDATFATLAGTDTFSGVKTFSAAPIVHVEDSRTNTTLRPFTVRATTSGTPAASLGVGLLFDAESGNENPSNFGALDFIASDVTAASEDTYASIALRVAGAALDEKYRFSSTAGSGFAALFTHANTADRTYTMTNADATLGQLSFKIGSFTRDLTTASGTQAVTGVGFTPRLVLFLGGGGDGNVAMSVGWDDGTTVGALDSEGGAATEAVFITRTTASINLDTVLGSQTAIITTLGSDGFTLTWTKASSPTGTVTLLYMALR